MILAVYRKLVTIVETEFSDIVITTNIMFTPTQRAQKLRLNLIDNSIIDIWLTLDGRYSYHWHAPDQIYRHDNAPHQKWNFVSTFPKHCHDGTEKNVIASKIPNEYQEAVRFFLEKIRNKFF